MSNRSGGEGALNGPSLASSGRRLVLEIAKRADALAAARESVGRAVAEAGVAEPHARRFVLAVDEGISSIVLEAGDSRRPDAGAGEILLILEIDRVRLRATIQDTTTIYDFPSTEIEGEAARERVRRHELGVFLMRKLCDEVNYSFMRGFQNQLELIRFLL